MLEEVRLTAAEAGISMTDALRQAMKIGLPKVRKKHIQADLKPFTKAEARAAFAPDPDWDRLEAAMARRPVAKPEAD